MIVTTDEITDPYNLKMTCEILRGTETRFFGETSTAKLHRKIEQIVEYLVRSNPVPAGSVLCTGTGIIATAVKGEMASDSQAAEAIRRGDIFQANLSQRFTLPLPEAGTAR